MLLDAACVEALVGGRRPHTQKGHQHMEEGVARGPEPPAVRCIKRSCPPTSQIGMAGCLHLVCLTRELMPCLLQHQSLGNV
jgi:hypothetical protein